MDYMYLVALEGKGSEGGNLIVKVAQITLLVLWKDGGVEVRGGGKCM
jgi:hypothetical protein